MRTGRIFPWTAALVVLAGGCSRDSAPPEGPAGPGAPPVIELFLVLPQSSVDFGHSVNLRWRASGATLATITPDIGEVFPPTSGVLSIRPHEDVTYTLTVSNEVGSDTRTATIDVEYPGGIYVDSVGGDDARDGSTPQTAVKTLETALVKARDIGVIFLSAGLYPTNVAIDSRQLEIYGGLNPETFLEEPDLPGLFNSIVQPPSGTPITVRNTSDVVILQNLIVNAPMDAEVVVDVQDAGDVSRPCRLITCQLNGRTVTAGSVVRIRGDSAVDISRCRIFGRRASALPESRGVLTEDESGVVITNCFIDGGVASNRGSGVELRGSGLTRLGFNTISAEITSFGTMAASVRIAGASPALGGNILFTQGSGRRLGVVEEEANSNPSLFEGNLLASVGAPAYDNFNGQDASTEQQLNQSQFTTSTPGTTFGNILVTAVGASLLFRNMNQGDYHLVSPLNTGPGIVVNPAINRGDRYLYSEDYGAVSSDIDGDPRPPGNVTDTDIGADEWR